MKRIRKVATPPTYIDRHKAIVSAKNTGVVKESLETLEANVALRFATYNDAFNNNELHEITESLHMQAYMDDLQSCYKKSTKPLRDIFKAIKEAQLTRSLLYCPYCGIALPKTHDHYLPEGRFPEFSAHALNLIPCCSSCNSIKTDRWLAGNNRIFINYYLDPLPDDQYLHIRIQSNPGSMAFGAVFSIVRPHMIVDDQLWGLIESHYRELHLLDRYKEDVNEEVSAVYDICCTHLQNGGHNIENFLRDLSDRNATVFGQNNWRVVLWKALALDQNFINLVNRAA
ncbi:MAG: hypothetical protein P4L44_15225 [Oryzomonas sp.]|uniref:HNH endonuclease n=1 Tax=Oryzomonas sp. TaxID=2855186 RepID=UPI00283CEDDB|nr:hypothetical protein [Oryzomonas sp.]MDR3581312.1 hypothetical protein [Oryzomonas sp.]